MSFYPGDSGDMPLIQNLVPCCAEIVLSGADKHQSEMNHSSAKLESSSQQVCHHVRGANAYQLTLTLFTQNSEYSPH